MNKKNFVVLNDLRSNPLITSIKLTKSIPNTTLLAHESIFLNKEYADYTNVFWKLFLKTILLLFFDLKIIKATSEDLSEEETMGFYSSLYSILEDSSASFEKYPKVFKEVKNLTLGSKDIVNYLKDIEVEAVFVFNGRTASSYLISKHCVNNNIDIYYYEYAGHDNGFRLYPVPPHASGRLGELLLKYYKSGIYDFNNLKFASEEIKTQKLNSKYKKIASQVTNLKFDVVIFLGSDFEYTAVDPQICEIEWKGNPEFCSSVVNKYGLDLSYAIRCHPNSTSDPNWPKLLNELQNAVKFLNANITIIPPNSLIDSHILIKNSKQVVTDLSIIALDSILLGKPTDIFGNTDIRYIYTDQWFLNKNINYLSNEILLPFALNHNFFVFRFNLIEKLISNVLFLIQIFFSKLYMIYPKNVKKFIFKI